MKILQLIFSLSSGGAEKVVVNLSNELVSEKNDVLICLILKKRKTEKIMKFYRLYKIK